MIMYTTIKCNKNIKIVLNTHVPAICTHLSLSSSTLASLPWIMNDDKKMKDDRVWKKPGITEDKE